MSLDLMFSVWIYGKSLWLTFNPFLQNSNTPQTWLGVQGVWRQPWRKVNRHKGFLGLRRRHQTLKFEHSQSQTPHYFIIIFRRSRWHMDMAPVEWNLPMFLAMAAMIYRRVTQSQIDEVLVMCGGSLLSWWLHRITSFFNLPNVRILGSIWDIEERESHVYECVGWSVQNIVMHSTHNILLQL